MKDGGHGRARDATTDATTDAEHVPEAAVGLPGIAVPAVRRRRDEELEADGWVRRFTGSPPRLGELTELYESTGQDVLLDDVLPGELATECQGCTLALAMFKVIYTRRGEG